MQAELIKMLMEGNPDRQKIETAASKIIDNAKACSEMLQEVFDESQR